MNRRSFLIGVTALAATSRLPRRAFAAPALSIAVTAAGAVDRVDFTVAVENASPDRVEDPTVELALDPDVYIDPALYYRLLEIGGTPAPSLLFPRIADGRVGSAHLRLAWRDAMAIDAGETRLYRASIAVANVHPHRYGMVATVAAPEGVVATSEPATHDRSLGALFAAAARRIADLRPVRTWGPYQFLPLRGGRVGLSAATGWPTVLVAVETATLARVGSLRLDRLPVVEIDTRPVVGAFYRLSTDAGAPVALFADPPRLAAPAAAPDIASELVAARPDLLYHEPPQVVGMMLPGTRGGRFGLSRDAQLSGFGATLFLNASALVSDGALAPRLGAGPVDDAVRLDRAAGGWWLTVSAALDEGGD